MEPFKIVQPSGTDVPILISIPHCSTHFPTELEFQYKRELISNPDDTDWYVDWIYDFVPEMGITTIKAAHSRFIVDLNRNPDDEPLYTDGRLITSVCPATTFEGDPVYKYDPPDELEIKRRVDQYFRPYHNQIKKNT